MAIVRTTKALAKRIDLTYFKRAHPLRSARWMTSLVVTILALIWLGYKSLESREVYMNGEISTPHQLFGVNCNRCHTDWGALNAVLEGKPSIPDKVCEECHEGSAHHWKIAPAADKTGVKLNEPHCIECHHEHHGEQELAKLPDDNCLECHKNLNSQRKDGYQFVNVSGGGVGISSFSELGGHPEFAAAKKPDQTQLKFNHKRHLAMEDIKSCEQCHIPDSNRNYMQPIVYEKHCASCHPVGITGMFASITKDMEPKDLPVEIRLPHGLQPKAIHGAVNKNLAALMMKEPGINSDVYDKKKTGRGRRAKITIAWKEMALKEFLVSQDKFLNEQVVKNLKKVVDDNTNGCRLCHFINDKDEDILSWTMTKTGIPQNGDSRRLYRHSSFAHKPHRMLQCTECHFATVNGNKIEVKDSTTTEHLLVAGVATCQRCHHPGSNSARSDCVECHNFHSKDHDRSLNGNYTIERIFEDYLKGVKVDHTAMPEELGGKRITIPQPGGGTVSIEGEAPAVEKKEEPAAEKKEEPKKEEPKKEEPVEEKKAEVLEKPKEEEAKKE